MQRALGLKIFLITLLGLLLLLPLALIDGQIESRMGYRYQARASIAESWTGAQTVVGPLLVVPYTLTRTEKVWDKEAARYEEVERQQRHELVLLPESLGVNTELDTERRQRGIFSVPVYISDHRMSGRFDLGPVHELGRLENLKEVGAPYLAVHVRDSRGIAAVPSLTWGQASLPFAAGSRLPELERGIHAPLPAPAADQTAVDFAFDLRLRGMERLSLAPVGRSTTVSLNSAWPHPSFSGRYLPERHEIAADGFQAQWQLSQFATDVERQVTECMAGKCQALSSNTFGVDLVEPVDVYLQAERSIKYGILFIGLTFVAFFLVEMLKGLRIHPMQYLLVGLALSIFFLLLVSLSEHIAFAAAYACAASACILLLAYYCGYVLRSRSGGLLLGGLLGLLYGVLYLIIGSEDHALLMGSGLLFLTLAAVMVLTRRLDWYAVGAGVQIPSRHKPQAPQAE